MGLKCYSFLNSHLLLKVNKLAPYISFNSEWEYKLNANIKKKLLDYSNEYALWNEY